MNAIDPSEPPLVEGENRALVAALGRPQTVLEVGCGRGLHGARAKRWGARVTGLEWDPAKAALARARLDEVLELEHADPELLEQRLAGRQFDLVLWSQVIGRVPAPEELLEPCLPLLGDGGRLIVSLPREPSARATARAMVERAGLELLVPHRSARTKASRDVLVARKLPERRQLSLTVGMLTMDEEQSVARMIRQIRAEAPDAQILCVDSSTEDHTPDIARQMGARVLRQIPPRGHGPAMELLMYSAAAQSELLIYLDCDFTYPPATIPVVRRIVEDEGADVVNCARTRRRPAAMPAANYLANRLFAAMAHAMHGVPTCDVHSGMRAYRSSLIRAFDFDGEGDAIPIDTLLFPAKCGYRVVELPISYDERVGVSKLRKLTGAVWTLLRLGRALPLGRWGSQRYELR